MHSTSPAKNFNVDKPGNTANTITVGKMMGKVLDADNDDVIDDCEEL